MASYAAATSTTTSFEKIRNAATSGGADEARQDHSPGLPRCLGTTIHCRSRSGLEAARNHIAELGLPPKHHLADPALAARLLGANKNALLKGESPGPVVPRDGTLLGALFESLVTLSVRVYSEAAESKVGHLRTHRGDHEVDLIVERDDGRVIGIEIKLGSIADDDAVGHLTWLKQQIGDDLIDAIIVTTGEEAYRRDDDIAVVPAALLGP